MLESQDLKRSLPLVMQYNSDQAITTLRIILYISFHVSFSGHILHNATNPSHPRQIIGFPTLLVCNVIIFYI